MTECTFAPNLESPSALAFSHGSTHPPNGQSAHLPGEHGPRSPHRRGLSDGAPAGAAHLESHSEPPTVRSAVSVTKWLQRQEAGRALEARKRSIPHSDGKGWTRQPTRPIEFELMTDGKNSAKREQIRDHLRSLVPVRAPGLPLAARALAA
jgi:hypothetical protein